MRLPARARTHGAPPAFAGLWEGWCSAEGATLRTFTIATTSAITSPDLDVLHEGLPVILEPEAWPVGSGEELGAVARRSGRR